MKLAQELADHIRQALDAAGIVATVNPYTDSIGGRYVEILEKGGGLAVARHELLSVPGNSLKSEPVLMDVDHWWLDMDTGPEQWHPDEPPAESSLDLGPWPGPGTAAVEIVCAIVRVRVESRVTGYATARFCEDGPPSLKLED